MTTRAASNAVVEQPTLPVNGTKEVALEPVASAIPATATGSDPMISMIERVLLDPAIDISKLERLEQMYERAQLRQAEQAFNAAMAAAQAEMRAVVADSYNKQTSSHYASYAAMDRMARPIYTKHGLALSFNSDESKVADHVLVLCYVTGGGYTRTYRADMPADGKGAKGGDVMTKTHATGSAFSYAQRYLLRLIFNLAVDEDDDGNKASGKEREVVAPEGFQGWVDKIDELVLKGCTRAGLNAAWEAGGDATEPFRRHITKVNVAHVEGWKKACKAAKS